MSPTTVEERLATLETKIDNVLREIKYIKDFQDTRICSMEKSVTQAWWAMGILFAGFLSVLGWIVSR